MLSRRLGVLTTRFAPRRWMSSDVMDQPPETYESQRLAQFKRMAGSSNLKMADLYPNRYRVSCRVQDIRVAYDLLGKGERSGDWQSTAGIVENVRFESLRCRKTPKHPSSAPKIGSFESGPILIYFSGSNYHGAHFFIFSC